MYLLVGGGGRTEGGKWGTVASGGTNKPKTGAKHRRNKTSQAIVDNFMDFADLEIDSLPVYPLTKAIKQGVKVTTAFFLPVSRTQHLPACPRYD